MCVLNIRGTIKKSYLSPIIFFSLLIILLWMHVLSVWFLFPLHSFFSTVKTMKMCQGPFQKVHLREKHTTIWMAVCHSPRHTRMRNRYKIRARRSQKVRGSWDESQSQHGNNIEIHSEIKKGKVLFRRRRWSFFHIIVLSARRFLKVKQNEKKKKCQTKKRHGEYGK